MDHNRERAIPMLRTLVDLICAGRLTAPASRMICRGRSSALPSTSRKRATRSRKSAAGSSMRSIRAGASRASADDGNGEVEPAAGDV